MRYVQFLLLGFIFFFTYPDCNAKLYDSLNNIKVLNQSNDTIHTKAKGLKRLVSYNIRHCEGMDNIIDYDRIVNIITALKPDVVCLQELDSMTTRSNIDQIKLLGERLGFYCYFGMAIPYKKGKYGLGILTKEKPIRTYHYSLPGVESRTFLIAEYPAYIVICAHLDLKESNRIESVNLITQKANEFHKKIYLAGDFNEDNPNGKMFSELFKNWNQVSVQKNTFPTVTPTKCIDYIFAFKQHRFIYNIKKKDVVYSLSDLDISNASDHYPIFIDFYN